MTSIPRRPHNLPQLLLRGFHWLDQGLQRNLRRLGGPELSHAQAMVILTIAEGIDRPSAIAEQLGISRQAVHQSLRGLLEAGIIELVADPLDGRAKVARLSSRGAPLHRQAAQILAALEAELVQRIGEADVDGLRAALHKPWGEPAEVKLPRARPRTPPARARQGTRRRK
jgi:DNA-binding MarR family transcriptional regulator